MPDLSQITFPAEGDSRIDLFQKKEVRKVLHWWEWWFSVKDVIESLVETVDGTNYVAKLRDRDQGLKEGWWQIVMTLPFQSTSGIQNTNFINIEGIFRVMQSVPSVKAEPFKKWLAKVWFERLQEEHNPDLAVRRAMAIYRSKWYDDDWIEARITNKVSRDLLTDVWDKAWMRKYIWLLTDAISIGTFGIKTSTHKGVKWLKGQSLRDNMTPIELTLTTLWEQTTREITRNKKPTTLQWHMIAASQWWRIAGSARENIERAIGRKVVSDKNYLTKIQIQNNAKIEPWIDIGKYVEREDDEWIDRDS